MTLYGGNGDNIVLRPLTDEHLPYISAKDARWCEEAGIRTAADLAGCISVVSPAEYERLWRKCCMER